MNDIISICAVIGIGSIVLALLTVASATRNIHRKQEYHTYIHYVHDNKK